MAKKPKTKMPVSERAKQFSPFAAVSGLEKALEREEKRMERIEKIELSEENADKLNQTLLILKKGDKISATYYSDGEYLQAHGSITLLDTVKKVIQIEEVTVRFDDLYKIKLAETT